MTAPKRPDEVSLATHLARIFDALFVGRLLFKLGRRLWGTA